MPPRPPTERVHDGFYLRLAAGPALARFATEQRDAESGIGRTVGFRMGGTVGHLVLGVGFSYDGLDRFGRTRRLDTASLFGDWFFDLKGGWHLLVALGSASGRLCGSPCDTLGSGTGYIAGFGYDAFFGSEWSYGGMVEAQRTSLTNELGFLPRGPGITTEVWTLRLLFTVLAH